MQLLTEAASVIARLMIQNTFSAVLKAQRLPLLACLFSQADNLTPKDITENKIHTPESWELPAAWPVSTCLDHVWNERLAGRRATLLECQAELSAKISLLRSTKWKHYSLNNIALMLDEAVNLNFS